MSNDNRQLSPFAIRLRQLRDERGLSLRRLATLALSSKSHINQFEMGKSLPNPQTLALIDRELRANGELIALAGLVREPVATVAVRADEHLRELLHTFLVRPDHHASGALMAGIDGVRRSVDRALATAGTITRTQVDDLAQIVDSSARDCITAPPLEMLCRLTLNMAEVQQHVAAYQQSGSVTRDLHAVAARLASLIADEMMVLGDVQQSRAWHYTARSAADKTKDRALKADVRTLAALLPLYYGDPREVVTITRQAQKIAGNTSSLTVAVAPAYESLALAQLNATEESETALTKARDKVVKLDSALMAESIFGFPERRWRFYEGKILSFLGRTDEAWEIHDEALALYPEDVVGDRALIHFDRSIALIRGQQTEAGCILAERTLLDLPDGHRTSIFMRAARRALSVVPRDEQSKPEVSRYRETIRSCPVVST